MDLTFLSAFTSGYLHPHTVWLWWKHCTQHPCLYCRCCIPSIKRLHFNLLSILPPICFPLVSWKLKYLLSSSPHQWKYCTRLKEGLVYCMLTAEIMWKMNKFLGCLFYIWPSKGTWFPASLCTMFVGRGKKTRGSKQLQIELTNVVGQANDYIEAYTM